MSKSRLSQYLEAKRDVRKSNDPDSLLRSIKELASGPRTEELLDLIITYGSVMEHQGYENGYRTAKEFFAPND